ncbi:protein tincar isoform X2 [Calliphora vicina]|uniref:protein tincar isoform X2 n=1 Tax=Calliphora vicina TaxID=7373 RepID=UPI00325BD176
MNKDMSITGSLLTYENNNHIVNKSKNRSSTFYSSNCTTSILSTTAISMRKTAPSSLNSSISNTILTDSTGNHKQHQSHPNLQSNYLPAKYMNSKRKHSKYNNSMYSSQMYPDHNNYLHLNSLWSIWYGVLLTLFQGYLAVHGAYRFLGCSLIPWKIEPVAELNLQIILSGLVFVLLPFFFTSAVFKVGNLANDGIKLGSAAKERRCTMVPHDGLEEESRGGTFRTLWTHGGPTAAFIHILIAMCLLLPRLLLEGRIIENGLLPRETIWQTELDFVTVNRRNLIALSVKASPYQNNTPFESQEDEDYFNDTIFTAYAKSGKNVNNLLDNNYKQQDKKTILKISGKTKYFELPDLVEAHIKENINDPNNFISEHVTKEVSTIPPIYIQNVTYEDETANKTLTSNVETTTNAAVDKYITSTNRYVDVGTITSDNFHTTYSIPTQPTKITPNYSEFSSFTSPNPKHISYHIHHHNQQHQSHNPHVGKSIRKHHRQRKISSSLAQRKNHQQHSQHHIAMKSSRRIDNVPLSNNDKSDESIDLNNLDELNTPHSNEGRYGGNVYEHRPTSYEESDYGHARVAIYPKSSTTISTTTRDSNIHIVKPEKLPEIIPSTPLSSNSKIIEIKTKPNKKIKRDISLTEENHVEIEPEYLVGDLALNDSSEYIADSNPIESSTISAVQLPNPENGVVRLDGFAGMLQLFFGVEKPIDVNVFRHPPSAEFVNLLFAFLVWCVRYPAVFWTTAKSFATIFSVQMIASAADIIFSFVGISNLFKLQIYSQGQPIQNPGLILNASVTLALFLLSVILILSSSMVMYLYGHGRLSVKMRDRSIISLKSNESWIYFAHCASLCYVLALSVVKAPLLNDLSATYRYNLHCPTFMAALVSVMHILLWIIIWLGLTVKRKWNFKLPPLDAYAIIGKATTQPLLMHNRGSLSNTTTASLNNSTTICVSSSPASENMEHKINCENSGNLISNASSSDILNEAPPDEIYWPKLAPSSPKLKVTFNEVTSTSDDDHHHRLSGEHEQNDGKRNSPCGTSVCFTSIEGEIDDGEYATLRSGTASIVGMTFGSSSETGNSIVLSKVHTPTGGVKVLHLSEYDELPPPPPNMISSMTITNHTTNVTINPESNYVNCLEDSIGKLFGDDNISEEGKLLECVRDDSVTYASTRDLEPPPATSDIITNNNSLVILSRNPQQMPKHSSSPDHLISPLAPIASSSTPRCLRRADSGVPQEALTPRSDTNSCGTSSTVSPPERAPSESSSGVHSAEEREIEVVIRPRVASKPLEKLPPPAIQEEPYGRCTNMRMSSFAGLSNANSATLPLQRSYTDQKFDYSQHCSTMPLPMNSHNHYQQQQHSSMYATSAHCMTQTQNAAPNVSSFKTPLYANSGVAMSGQKTIPPLDRDEHTRPPIPPPPQVTHTTLPNGTRYSNPNILRRHPYIKGPDPLYSQTFSKSVYESSLVNSTIHEDRDSANYSMISDQESLYATANALH